MNNLTPLWALTRLKSAGLCLALSLTLAVPTAFAVDIMDTAENIFFPSDPGNSRVRVGIEVEYMGLSPAKSAKLLRDALGGRVEKRHVFIPTTIKKKNANGKTEYNYLRLDSYFLLGSPLGDIEIKLDINQTSETKMPDPSELSVELVTEPIKFEQVKILQQALALLKASGAIGTDGKNPVATQVNVEWDHGDLKLTNIQEVVDLLRAYFRPQHQEQIQDHLQVPPIRQKFVQGYSGGMMRKLLNPKYAPTAQEFLVDFFYRQSLELQGDASAWRISEATARERLLSKPDPIVPKVVKLNALRISSLLIALFPEDPLCKLYESSGWAKGRPLVEFRQWNTDFEILPQVKQALGIITGAKQLGYFDHDGLLAEISAVPEETIIELRKKSNRQNRKGQSIFRYFLGDSEKIVEAEYEEMRKAYRGTQVGFLNANTYGIAPVVIPGESVVFHRRHFHRTNIQGKYNPGLINHNVQQALENKLVEGKFWNEFAPGAMPETISLFELTGATSLSSIRDVELAASALTTRFPMGWVLKGVWDLGSEKDILTDKIDLVAAVRIYETSEFEKFKAETTAKFLQYKDSAPEYLLTELKKHPGYKGWRIKLLLCNPHLAIVQNRVNIDREFRVEMIGGKVLGNGSTLDRFYYMYKFGIDGLKMSDYFKPTQSQFDKVETFAQQIVNRLPVELRGTPFAFDIALLTDGGMAMIESNAGGNSNFLFEEERASAKALEGYMSKFPLYVQLGLVHLGLTPTEQMSFLATNFARWGIDPAIQYPGMSFQSDQIVDSEYKPTEPRKERYEYAAPSASKAVQTCASLFGGI